MNYNRNIIIGAVIAHELAKKDVQYAIIGAGSRSTPLTVAFSQHPNITAISQVDERSAGFMALGIAQYTRNPVVLISTSGTAAANFYPAIIEAKRSNIQLLVLTADRPTYLRDSGANQTIDQINLYGTHVNNFLDLIPPTGTTRLLHYCKIAITKQFKYTTNPSNPGPTHTNIPFDKPLGPDGALEVSPVQVISHLDPNYHQISVVHPELEVTIKENDHLDHLLTSCTKILILAGPKSDTEVEFKTLYEFSTEHKIPIFADGVSGLRVKRNESRYVISSFDTFLRLDDIVDRIEPELIIQIGQLPVSKYLLNAMEKWEQTRKVIVTKYQKLDTADYIYDSFILCPVDTFLAGQQRTRNEFKVEEQWVNDLLRIEESTWQVINEFLDKNQDFEGTIVKDFINQLQDNAALFVSSSLAIRHVDQFIRYFPETTKIFANRGASGIDGTLSTALGIAEIHKGPSYLLTGDLSFYHDMNGLLAMQRYNIELRVLILNNQGGAIFDRLPIAKFDPPFTEFFLTPHLMNFELISAAFGLYYEKFRNEIQMGQDGIYEHVSSLKDIQSKITELINILKTNLVAF